MPSYSPDNFNSERHALDDQLVNSFLGDATMPTIDYDDCIERLKDVDIFPMTTAQELVFLEFPLVRSSLTQEESFSHWEFHQALQELLNEYREQAQEQLFNVRDILVRAAVPYRATNGSTISSFEVIDRRTGEYLLPDLRALQSDELQGREFEFFECPGGVRIIFELPTLGSGVPPRIFPVFNDVSKFEACNNMFELRRPTQAYSPYSYVNDQLENFISRHYFEAMRLEQGLSASYLQAQYQELKAQGFMKLLFVDGLYSDHSFNFVVDVRVPPKVGKELGPEVDSFLVDAQFGKRGRIHFRLLAKKSAGKESELFNF